MTRCPYLKSKGHSTENAINIANLVPTAYNNVLLEISTENMNNAAAEAAAPRELTPRGITHTKHEESPKSKTHPQDSPSSSPTTSDKGEHHSQILVHENHISHNIS